MQAPPPGYASSMPLVSLNEQAAKTYLASKDWPLGFQVQVLEQVEKIPLRFFICDDCGSMYESDGKQLTYSQNSGFRAINCSRYVIPNLYYTHV